MKTTVAKVLTAKDRPWHIVDADGKTLGRLATVVATVLNGKHRPSFTPHVDTGDYVVIINTDKIHVTGNKEENKIYYTHSEYLGHIFQQTFAERMKKDSQGIVKDAIAGMLPKNKLRADKLLRLKLFPGAEHTHTAQSPVPLHV